GTQRENMRAADDRTDASADHAEAHSAAKGADEMPVHSPPQTLFLFSGAPPAAARDCHRFDEFNAGGLDVAIDCKGSAGTVTGDKMLHDRLVLLLRPLDAPFEQDRRQGRHAEPQASDHAHQAPDAAGLVDGEMKFDVELDVAVELPPPGGVGEVVVERLNVAQCLGGHGGRRNLRREWLEPSPDRIDLVRVARAEGNDGVAADFVTDDKSVGLQATECIAD